jgi:hypothetical protein
LSRFRLEAFDLEVANDTFLIQGTPTRKEPEKSPLAKLNSFKNSLPEHLSHLEKTQAVRNSFRTGR